MIKTKVLVIGSGPGGYTAAFRAADLGNEVTLIEAYKTFRAFGHRQTLQHKPNTASEDLFAGHRTTVINIWQRLFN